MNEAIKLPLWKACLDRMREEGLAYGKTWKADYFERALRQKRNTPEFVWELLPLRQTLEDEDGYYLRQKDNGDAYEIPTAAGHEDVAQMHDHKCRRHAVRSVNVRSATLQNPLADLTAEERARTEKNLERATTRLLLMSRQQSVMNALRKTAPRLLLPNKG